MTLGAGRVGASHPTLKITSALRLSGGVDISAVVVLEYPADEGLGAQPRTAICTSSIETKAGREFARIEGSKGRIVISGLAASCPDQYEIQTIGSDGVVSVVDTVRFAHSAGTKGFIHEADAVARDIASGKRENATMPLDETMRMMRLLDGVRADNGLVYPGEMAV